MPIEFACLLFFEPAISALNTVHGQYPLSAKCLISPVYQVEREEIRDIKAGPPIQGNITVCPEVTLN